MQIHCILCNVTLLAAIFSLATPSSCGAVEGMHRVAFPVLPGEDRIICELESGDVGGGSSANSNSAFSRRRTSLNRFNSLHTQRFRSNEDISPDVDQGNALARNELAAPDISRRRAPLQPFELEDQLSRYESPQPQPDEELRRDQPQSKSPVGKKPFENLRRFGVPNYRQSTPRSQPFAQAATFGTGPGVVRPQYVRHSSSSCRPSRHSILAAHYLRR